MSLDIPSPRRWLSGVVVAVVVAGCGAPPPTQGQQQPIGQLPQQQPDTQPPTVSVPRPPRNTQAAPAGAVALTASYTPFATGRSWTYKVTSALGDKQETGTVSWKIDEASDKITTVTITSEVGGKTQTVSNKAVKNDDGTVTITTTTDGQSQSQTVKPEEAAGATGGPGAGGGQAAQGVADTVSVPAGSFEALKVVNQLPDNQGTITAWYADGVGLVKQEINAKTQQGDVRSTMELTAHAK